MVRPSSEFEVAWRSLKSNADVSGWRTIAVTPSGARSLAAGRCSPGDHQALLVGFPDADLPVSEKLPDGVGFRVERVDPYGDKVTRLALTCKASGDADLFMTMVCDVAGSLDDEKNVAGTQALRCFLGRVRAWQEFMRKGGQQL
ncbi:MAG: PD-(D/E)XK motif protein, partial [Rhodanobacter sp.]